MADDAIDKKVISKNNAGFPPELDFDRLRTDSIDYLGQLTGKIWTDYNAHDPGITILEALIYAIIDLGYRTGLPVEDILSPAPGSSVPDDNFYTPAQILTCNPVTITDYRKLLVDIDGVNNAWLEVDTKITIDSICGRKQIPSARAYNEAGALLVATQPDPRQECCVDYLNGLYHVYIDVENRYNGDQQTKFQTCVVEKVRKALMSHRNLCEDFVDIHLLCKYEIGACADIELQPGADAEQTYKDVVELLRNFFSPSPKFYTLQQLLDKNVSIEEIFAGRPYNTGESHGFVDTREFEAIRFRREIHVSDIYPILLTVKGVKAVRMLQLKRCAGNTTGINLNEWVIQLPENYIADFSLDCSAFRFIRNSQVVPVDTKKFDSYFKFNFSNNGKKLYPAGSPYLDAVIKYGNYRSDLGDYISVQDEFPAVYAIGHGELAIDAKNSRKAQALQLKGYLLFFDQLLANYLAQLKNIRSLFSFSQKDTENKHSYFVNNLNAGDMSKLLRFAPSNGEGKPAASKGETLARPVDRKSLKVKIEKNEQTKTEILKDLRSYSFGSIADCETAMNLLRMDLGNSQWIPQIVDTVCDQVFFYFENELTDIAIVSKKTYSDRNKATSAAGFVCAIAAIKENYKRYTDSHNHISFEIEFNLFDYLSNLQQIIESGAEYLQRRNIFLDHLLSRFAERFTDFALLSYRDNANDLEKEIVVAKEKFLQNYPGLGSNRGRAYDYTLNGWNNDNVSGFERKFKAMAGIGNWKRHSLCNFVVEAEDEEFTIAVPYGLDKKFKCVNVFGKAGALESMNCFFNALVERPGFEVAEIPGTGSFEICRRNADNNRYCDGNFSSKKNAEDYAAYLNGLYNFSTSEKDVFESSYLYFIHLTGIGKQDVILRTYHAALNSTNEVRSVLGAPFKEINQLEKWKEAEPLKDGDIKPHLIGNAGWPSEYVNEAAFRIDINDTIEGKPGLFNYELLDRKHHLFKLKSVNEFATRKEAEADCHRLLFLLAEESNYRKAVDKDFDKPYLEVVSGDKAVAKTEIFSSTEKVYRKIELIKTIARSHRYILIYNSQPDKWKFSYRITAPGKDYLFESRNEFGEKETALEQSRLFVRSLTGLIYDAKKQQIIAADKAQRATIPIVMLVADTGIEEKEKKDIDKEIDDLLNDKKSFYNTITEKNSAKMEAYLQKTARSKDGDYVYRLVDKDNLIAFYTGTDVHPDCNDATSRRTAFKQLSTEKLWWLEISQGNDIIVEEKDEKTGVSWFHYQLRCLNRFNSNGKELPLFESVRGYSNTDDARTAFDKEYFDIIQLALVAENYGRYISIDRLLVHETGACATTEMKVFIPVDTLNEMGHYFGEAIRNIVALVHRFPIREIIKDSDDFNKLFRCPEDIESGDCMPVPVKDNCSCGKNNEQVTVYYFVVENEDSGVLKKDWQSVNWFNSAADAMQQFRFFCWLHDNRVNYTVSQLNCDCDCKIYIREVMAESAGRFPDPATAWGKSGIERFICVSQTENAFQPFFNNNNCCNSFYVACGNAHAIHPCKYDTAEERNQAMANLITGVSAFATYPKPGIFLSDDGKTILDIHKNPIADFVDPLPNLQMTFCEKLFYLWHLMIRKCNYKKEENSKAFLKDETGKVVATAIDDISLSLFIEKMQEAAFYLPITESRDRSSATSYCIKIKFPCVPGTVIERNLRKDCGCESQSVPGDNSCFVAWEGPCCFPDCDSAFLQYLAIIELLKDAANYHSVFDCTCNSYGIRLHKKEDIIAFSPQCYDSAEGVCDAISRAGKLINCEGLHLVEHILLRPHCEHECDCLVGNNDPCDKTHCEQFRWSPLETLDPCITGEDVCFHPGADPYSFIATVVLPAWPWRFRGQESRAVVERMLYQEAPAHVMLRILWLAPHDLCCFETHYKKWGRYLAGKNTCDKDYKTCSFIDFLFKRNYEILEDCNECICAYSSAPMNPCSADFIKEKISNPILMPFVDQANDFFCWSGPGKYEFIECGERIRPAFSEETIAAPVTIENVIPAPAPVTDMDWLKSKERRDMINNRNSRYRRAINEIVNDTEGYNNPIPSKAQRFLLKTAPELTQLTELVEEAIQNKIPGSKKLSKKMAEDVVVNAIHYYMDRISFDQVSSESQQEFFAFIKQHEKKLDSGSLFKKWNIKEVKVIQPGLDIKPIRKAMTTDKK